MSGILFNKNGIPEELKRLRQWVCWQAVPDPARPDHPRKTPINPRTGKGAMSNNPDTWTDYDTAFRESIHYTGIGFMFAGGYFGVDIDNCEEAIEDYRLGGVDNIVAEFIGTLRSYAEYSQSGRGIHIICRGKLPPGGRRKGSVEMYDSGRFFVMTGNQAAEYTEIADCGERIKPLHEKYIGGARPKANRLPAPVLPVSLSDSEILEKAGKAKAGAVFQALYNGEWEAYFGSQSEADLSLCNRLAYWTRKDPEAIDRLFRSSGLMRDKWDELHGKETYGRITVNKALEWVTAAGSSEKAFTPLNWDGTPETDVAACELLPPTEFVESLSREDLLNPDKVRPVFELPAENRAAYIAEIETRVKREKLWNPWQQLAKALKTQQAEQLRAEKAKSLPAWAYLDGFGAVRINEPDFIQIFTGRYTLVCENGIIYGMDGQIEDRDIRQLIQREIAGYITSDLAAKTDKLLKALKNDRNGTLPPPQLDRIHLQNGTLMLKERVLKPEKEFARNRLPVSYDPSAKCPRWLKFLENLLEPDDIRTLQEFIGYLLIPTNKAQVSLFICGKGGEGKSIVIKIVSALFGTSCLPGKLKNIQERFGLSGLEGKLVFVDDDITSEAFRATDVLKEVITANKPVNIERKGVDSYAGTVYARFLCCGNNFASALYDNSDGFFRRQMLLLTRPGSQVENPDRELADKLIEELPGILNWALDGLERLRWNGWNFTVSARSREALEEQRRESCNVISFMESDFVRWGEDLQATSEKAYTSYTDWCRINGEDYVKQRTFVAYLRQHYDDRVKYSNHVKYRGHNVRGFIGFEAVDYR